MKMKTKQSSNQGLALTNCGGGNRCNALVGRRFGCLLLCPLTDTDVASSTRSRQHHHQPASPRWSWGAIVKFVGVALVLASTTVSAAALPGSAVRSKSKKIYPLPASASTEGVSINKKDDHAAMMPMVVRNSFDNQQNNEDSGIVYPLAPLSSDKSKEILVHSGTSLRGSAKRRHLVQGRFIYLQNGLLAST